MKIYPIKSIITIVLITLITLPELQASDIFKLPKRRKGKQTAKNEVVHTPQDSLTATTSIADVAEQASDVTTAVMAVEVAPRRNTPQQIDSLIAMWRKISTTEAYDRYFKSFVSSLSQDSVPADAMDTIYIARLNALMSPVPLKYNYEVRNAIDRFIAPSYATKMGYAYYYFPMIEEELIRAGLPVELRTLAFVESGLNPLAESRAGAKGLWQFMPSTGKEYGLEINSLVDERCNPRLATRAACQYLKRMYDAYGDWTLAIASYNCGPGNVNKAIMRSGGDPREYNGSFWDVYDRLPSETRNYVPLYMGATYAFAYHEAHGVEYPVPDMPLAVDTIMINRPLHLEQVSSTIDIDIELLRILNPEYLLSIIPATTKSYPLTLPVEYVSRYLVNEEEIYSKDTTYLKEYTIHANLDKKKMEAPPAKYHTVKRGETLGAIARKYGRTVKQLMNWNNIKNANTLRVGQRLRVSAS